LLANGTSQTLVGQEQIVVSFDPKQLSCNAPMLCSNGHDLEISGVLKGIIKNPGILEDYIREFPPN